MGKVLASQDLFAQAQTLFPGGVNSPVRAFKGVGGNPFFVEKGKGAYLYDTQGKSYLDFVLSWGPLVLGHAHPAVISAVQQAANSGLGFGAPCENEIRLAKLIQFFFPSMEMMRLVSSGTEACMSAIRLARGFTGRDKILKFIGCYHGHADSLLVAAGSGGLTFGVPNSKGVPEDFAKHTLLAEFNSIEQVKTIFKEHGKNIAAILIEPIAGNMNLVLPKPDFLFELRKICDEYESLLVFDEVMTGLRAGLHGAQGLYDIKPDLTTLAKVIGGGLPAAAFGGRSDVMQHLAPLGGVYQAGTLSGNPVALSAGIATLTEMAKPGVFDALSESTHAFIQEFIARAKLFSLDFQAQSIGSMFGLYFSKDIPTCEADVAKSNKNHFQLFFHAMLEQGVYLAPSLFEAGFTSTAHTQADYEKALKAAEISFKKLK